MWSPQTIPLCKYPSHHVLGRKSGCCRASKHRPNTYIDIYVESMWLWGNPGELRANIQRKKRVTSCYLLLYSDISNCKCTSVFPFWLYAQAEFTHGEHRHWELTWRAEPERHMHDAQEAGVLAGLLWTGLAARELDHVFVSFLAHTAAHAGPSFRHLVHTGCCCCHLLIISITCTLLRAVNTGHHQWLAAAPQRLFRLLQSCRGREQAAHWA